MEKIYLIIAIITTVVSAGLIKIIKVFIKEAKEAVNVYKEALKDKKITADEEKVIAKESMEAIEAAFNVWFAARKAFGLIKSKVNKKK